MALREELIKTSLRASITETAANTYTEKEIHTNLSARGDHIFVVTGIWWQVTAPVNADNDRFTMQITYGKQTDTILLDDSDWFGGQEWALDVVTSGGGFWDRIVHQVIDHFPVAVPVLYFGCKGGGLATAGQGSVKIEGYHMKVNTNEYFRLAQGR